LEFGLLGSLAVWVDGRELPLDGGKQWAVLAVLLMRPNEPVPTARLVEELWGDQPTASSSKAVHEYVSRLRKALGRDLLETRPPGYVLHLAPGGLDAQRFESLLAQGSRLLAEGAAEDARRLLGKALALWRGPALADFRYESFARVEAARLEDLRLAALEERVVADLALGRHAELVGELEGLIVEHPYRERLRGQLMLALYRSGRQADALRAYRDARAALDELGIEPGQPLKRLEQQILNQDAALEPSRSQRLATVLVAKPALPGPLVPSPPFPFVGRERELGKLRALRERAAGGEGSLVLLGAEAGGGKTRLVREFAHEAVAEGAVVCYGVSDAAVSTPYQPLREWLEFLLRVCEPDSLRECLGADGESLARLVPKLARLTGRTASPAGDPESDRYLIQSAATALFGRLSERQPLLLVADDVHWSDGETLQLLRRLARTAPEARLLVIAVYRDRGEELGTGVADTIGDLSRLDASTRFALGGLSADEVGAFVRASGDAEPSAELTSALGELTDGTPLLLCELWRDLRESGSVEEADGGLRLSRPPAELRGSERIGDLVRERLARLTPELRVLLELAAVAGPRFESRVLAEAAGLERMRLASGLEELIRAGFVEELPGPPTGRFAHELVRRAVYDRIIGIRRAQLHLQVGEALERAHEADPAAVLPEIAHHFTQAAPVAGADRGVDYNLRAGRAALAAGALAEGAARFQTALELGIADPRERARVEGELSYPLFETGRGAEAEALLEESIETAAGLGERGLAVRLQVQLGLQRWRSDPGWNTVEMERLAEQAIETLAELGDRSGLASAERLLGLSIGGQGRMSEGLAAHERALAHADAAGDSVARRRSIVTLGAGLCNGPTPVADGIRRCEQLRETYRDDRLLEAVLTRFLSLLYAMAGRSDDARESVRTSSRVLDELQERTLSHFLRRCVAVALELAGDRAGAEREWTARWVRLRDLSGDAPDQDAVLAAADLAGFYCDEGRWEEGADLLVYRGDVGDVAHRRNLTPQVVRARLAAHSGEHADALTLIGQVVERVERGEQLTMRAQVQVALAEVQMAAGNLDEADAAVGRALALYERKGNVVAAARLRLPAT
jgi:DNA-binding SARP family transcriptional activator